MFYFPKIGQGTGYDLYKSGVNKNDVFSTINKGVELGLNLIDTAENYANGEIEKIIGEVIRKRRERIVVSTKFLPQNSSYKKVIRSCENSLKRLKTYYIDIYQFHWPNPRIPLEHTLEALILLKKSGKIKEFGVGNFSLRQLHEAKLKLDKGKIFSLQCEFNLFERAIEQNGIIDFCTQNKVKIIAFSPLDQGRLDAMNKKQKKLLQEISNKHRKTVAQVILAWILSKKILTPIPMTLNLKHLAENADALSLTLEDNEVAQIDETFYSKLDYIPVELIRVLPTGERHAPAYRTIREAYENKLGLVPSPKELSEEIKKSGFLKPVRLIKTKSFSKKLKYDLIAGRARYWAWVIAYGRSKPIPAYVRDNLKID